jgi:hypothetical protein
MVWWSYLSPSINAMKHIFSQAAFLYHDSCSSLGEVVLVVLFGHEKVLGGFNIDIRLALAKITGQFLLFGVHVPNSRSVLPLVWIRSVGIQPEPQDIRVGRHFWIVLDENRFGIILNVLVRGIDAVTTRISNQTAFTKTVKGRLRVPESSERYNRNLVRGILMSRAEGNFRTFPGRPKYSCPAGR